MRSEDSKHNNTALRRIKKLVRYREGAELYSIGLTKFQEMAHEAKAVCKIGKLTLVDCEMFEKHLKKFMEE